MGADQLQVARVAMGPQVQGFQRLVRGGAQRRALQVVALQRQQIRIGHVQVASRDHALARTGPPPAPGQRIAEPARSEEHTSELQSLMRISYAVFCLKKKKTKH